MQQATTWVNEDPDLWHLMASLNDNELNHIAGKSEIIYSIGIHIRKNQHMGNKQIARQYINTARYTHEHADNWYICCQFWRAFPCVRELPHSIKESLQLTQSTSIGAVVLMEFLAACEEDTSYPAFKMADLEIIEIYILDHTSHRLTLTCWFVEGK